MDSGRSRTVGVPRLVTRLPVGPARDEINCLGTTFNQLLARLQAALERERQFVTNAGHELRTPLGLLTTELELALRRPRSTPELTAALRSALDETTRLARLARDAVAARYRHTLGDKISVECPPG
jgi:signal transduction histidine kinase